MKRVMQMLLVAAALAARPAGAHIHITGLDENGQCVGDVNNDAEVKIDEIITAVNNALGGCPSLPITLNFKGFVGDRPFACGTVYSGIGTGSSQFIPSDFRFYVSNIKLVTVAGDEIPLTLDQDGVWQYQNVSMIDFETGPDNGCGEGNTATHTTITGTVPAGVYTGVKFDLGLPFDLNHGDESTAPSPLNFTAMFWSWNGGYKFLRLDTADDKFRVHLGSIGCNGESASRPPTACTRPDVSTISLTGFNPVESVIVADLAALLADNNIDTNQPNSAPGCMSDPDDQDCAPVFRNLGLNFADGSASPSTQKFFRVESAAGAQGHVEYKVASSTSGGGALIANPTFDVTQPIELPFDQCFGGTGDECDGGTRVFSAANPGIEPIDPSMTTDSLFSLADGTQITLQVVSIDSGLSFQFGGTTLDSAGTSVVLGTSPSFHADLQAQITAPGGGEPSGTYSVTFKLTTTSSQYQASDTFTVKFTPVDA
jgi:uncharacterized repeat protein (TIGR04052 family)